MEPILSIVDAMAASEGYVRPMREGEEVKNAGLIVGIGLKERKGDILHVQGLVLRTSALMTEHPYLVEVWVDVSKDFGERLIDNKSPECGCPAGQSAKCKHVIAIMLQLSSTLESDLDDLTCTDIEQQWGAMKKTKLQDYQAKPLKDFCHHGCQSNVYASPMPEVTPEMRLKWIDRLTKCAVLSEYSLFGSGLRRGMGSAVCDADAASREAEGVNLVSQLLAFRSHKALGALHNLTEIKKATLDDQLLDFYMEYVELNFEESVAVACGCQGSPAWHAARQRVLNSSKARAQYTYFKNSKADWNKRYEELYHPKFSGSDYTEAGLEAEGPCRELYEDANKCNILLTGTLIRPELPWVGASLDGTVMSIENNRIQFIKNIEIKTFKEGKRLTAQEMLDFGAVSTVDLNGNLKVATQHYAQIQLGMLLSGMNECDYLIYSTHGKDYVSLTIPFDEKHVLELGSKLIHVYFDEILPRIMNDVLKQS